MNTILPNYTCAASVTFCRTLAIAAVAMLRMKFLVQRWQSNRLVGIQGMYLILFDAYLLNVFYLWSYV